MDEALERLAELVERCVRSDDPSAFALMTEAVTGTGDRFLPMRLIQLREVYARADSAGKLRRHTLELLLELRRTHRGAYGELRAVAEAFESDRIARSVPRGGLRPPAAHTAGRAPGHRDPYPPVSELRNAVSGGSFLAPVVQAGTFNGGVHTYYGGPEHSGPPPVGAWPRLAAADPVALGVRRTRRTGDEPHLPPYVPRDADAGLAERVRRAAAKGGLVLVAGEPLAGKSRSAWAATVTCLPATTRLLAPAAGTDLRTLPALLRDAGTERCALWLDELDGHLGERGLTPALLAELVQRRVPVVATMGDDAYDAHRFGGGAPARMLAGVEPVELSQVWTGDELARLSAAAGDSRLGDARHWCEDDRIAAFLAVGPELWDEWWRARRPGAHPHGHLLVRAALDLARCGTDDAAVPAELLREVAALYGPEETGRAAGEPFDAALAWAAGVRHGVAGMLVPGAEPGTWRAFGSLHRDAVSRPDAPPVPLALWPAALAAVPERPDLRGLVVECARSELAPSADGNPEVGTVLGRLYEEIGEPGHAEEWFRRAADAGGVEAAAVVGRTLAARGEIVPALGYLEQAAGAGDTEAAADLVPVLVDRAVFWLDRLGESGDARARDAAEVLRAFLGTPPTSPVEAGGGEAPRTARGGVLLKAVAETLMMLGSGAGQGPGGIRPALRVDALDPPASGAPRPAGPGAAPRDARTPPPDTVGE